MSTEVTQAEFARNRNRLLRGCLILFALFASYLVRVLAR
jgi:hypothetical protein